MTWGKRELSSNEIMDAVELYEDLYYSKNFELVLLTKIGENGICTCGSSFCKSPGKHPQIKWLKKNLLKEKNITKPEFSQWFQTMLRFNNFGIKTGKSKTKSLVVIDFDEPEKEVEFINKLKETKSCEITTGKGIHFYFYSDIKSKIKPKDRGFDIICNGRYVVGPDSTHKSGKKYEWNKVYPIDMPDWLKIELEKLLIEEDSLKEKESDLVYNNTNETFDKRKKIQVGKRNETLFKQLMIFAKDKTKTLKEIKEQALIIRKRMEDPDSFSNIELEKVCLSVMKYKAKNKINIQNEFCLKHVSEIWAKKLSNLGIIPNEFQETIYGTIFFDLEKFLLDKAIIIQPLTETFTGTRVLEFIEYRDEVMNEVFEHVPIWNYVNNAFQNWSKVFYELKLEKRLYVGAKYTKGLKERRKTGFGFSLRKKEETINLIKIFFKSEIEKLLNFSANPKGRIRRFNFETDKKIFDYYGIKIKEPKKAIVNFTSASLSIMELLESNGLSDDSGVITVQSDIAARHLLINKGNKNMSETTEEIKDSSSPAKEKNSPPGIKKTKTIEVKKEFHSLHYKKYGGTTNLIYSEADMDYQFTVSTDKNGIITDKEKTLKTIDSFKKGDVIGLGVKTYVFDSYDSLDEEVVVFDSYELENRVPIDIKNKKFLPLSLINKYIDMGYVDILYRDGELFGVEEKKKITKYEIYEFENENGDSSEEKKEETDQK